jgi:hypothetical protein
VVPRLATRGGPMSGKRCVRCHASRYTLIQGSAVVLGVDERSENRIAVERCRRVRGLCAEIRPDASSSDRAAGGPRHRHDGTSGGSASPRARTRLNGRDGPTPCFRGSCGAHAHLWVRVSPDRIPLWRLVHSNERGFVVHKWCMDDPRGWFGVWSGSSLCLINGTFQCGDDVETMVFYLKT